MRTIKAIIVGVACLTAGAANAQWVVHDPGNLAQGIINTTKEIVETSATAQHTLDGFKETAKIFEQGRKYYDALKAVHDVVKVTGMSLSDAERLAIIDQSYKRLLEYRNLVQYYTDKNISVSYLRAKKKKDADRVVALYGDAEDRYW